MLRYKTRIDDKTGQEWIETKLTGKSILSTPLLNKATAFSMDERIELKLLGKLPYGVETLDEQLIRAKNQYERYTSTLQKYIYLNNLHDKNEILFYRLLIDNLAQMLPLIYTPGVSDAVKEFSHEFRQPRGLYIAYPDLDRMEEILDNRTHADIDLIVVTDGERILGIGDQGIGGMDIPIAKLVVYSICGINPYKTLPILLDVGTDNSHLLQNPMYLGWRHPRVRGQEYDKFIDRFVKCVHKKMPTAFLHWEDFAQQNARRILEQYRNDHCTFNDDMQGTGVVTLAGLLSAIQTSEQSLAEQRIVIFGAGTAGVGIADQLYQAMLRAGITPEKAQRQFWLVDRQGLLLANDAHLQGFQQPYARPDNETTQWSTRDLLTVVQAIKPTILIGASTVKGAFTEEIVKSMAQGVARPIIFPLSNPTEHSEADPVDLLHWTGQKALIATGSPFVGVAQCNNALSFPGIGLGVVATKATKVTDNMLYAAVQAIVEQAPASIDPQQPLLPSITQIRELACHVGLAVAKQAIADGVATVKPALEIDAFRKQQVWQPFYRPIKLLSE